ncbi:MAG: VWA domain-containing protein, partial [Terracidiphilus sp.]
GPLPDAPPATRLSADGSEFTMRTTVRLVDVSLGVWDKKGRAVTDLRADDFELYDNDVRQQLSYFSQPAATRPAQPAVTAGQPAQAADEPVFTNRPAAPAAREAAGATVLMIDSANLAWSDLSYARQEMLRFLKTLPPDRSAGLYVMRRYDFEILAEPTSDRDRLTAVLKAWMPSAQDLSHAQEAEERNRQHFDWVHSKGDLTYVNGNESISPETQASGPQADAQAVMNPVDARLRTMGANPSRDAFLLLTGLARHLAAIPGHKSLVWVSSDNALADWSSQAAQRQDKGNSFADPLSLGAQEALNDARVSIYPLDASQLEAGGISADLGNRNVQVVGKSGRDPSLADLGDALAGSKPGRDTATMKQDTRPIAPQIRALADGTGGRALRRAGDIAVELDRVSGEGAAAYLLGFTPSTPADDAYHHIAVRLAARKDLTLQYRTGYLYTREPASLRERFRAAVWNPADAAELILTAKPQTDAHGKLVQIVIAPESLDLAQEGDFATGKMYIFLVDRDDAALHAKVTGQTVGLHLKPATWQRIQKEGMAFDQRLDAPLTGSSLRVIVVDEGTGRMGSVTIPATALGAGR